MATTPATITVHVDMRRFRAALAHATYHIARVAHIRNTWWRRVPDTPSLVDARDLAYTRDDAAQGPAPWETTNDIKETR